MLKTIRRWLVFGFVGVVQCGDEAPAPPVDPAQVTCAQEKVIKKNDSKSTVKEKWGNPDETTELSEEIAWYYGQYTKNGRIKCVIYFAGEKLSRVDGETCNTNCYDVTSF